MSHVSVHQGWKVRILLFLGLMGAFASQSAIAQITPDGTLGGESSRVTEDVTIRGANGDRIDGGAIRGSNLFHSFSEFNVNEGQRVYFANPSGISNILGRVTGTDVSDIMGTLGVDGNADLFLLNPNGIIFGPNARLDIGGSFFASTGDSIAFPDGTQFSASNPGDLTLLSVNVPLGVQYGPTQPGSITNAGNLTVGENLRLAGGSVDSTGLLAAPSGQLRVEGVAGDVQIRQAAAQTATFSASNNLILQESQLQTAGAMNLLAGNTVRIRDSIANPFVAYAGGSLTVQGNQNVDIFALNHPSSGLVSGGDMVLRSANTVGGDAHYWTGGKFQIEQLNGNLGNLFSPYDPVIRSNGDVSFNSYEGASLHIFAGGSVTINESITITGADTTSGLPAETVELSTLRNPIDPRQHMDQPRTVMIDGTREPTLDIRAGTTAVGTPSVPTFIEGNNIVPNPPPVLNSNGTANISIGGISFCSPVCVLGQIFLTNQYFPNQLPGSIRVGNSSGGESIVIPGGLVVIDSRGDIGITNGINGSNANGDGQVIHLLSRGGIVTGGIVSNGSTAGSGGEVYLNAFGNITTDAVRSDSGGERRVANNGDIRIVSRNGSIHTRGSVTSATINASGRASNTSGSAGNITLDAFGDIVTGSDRAIGISDRAEGVLSAVQSDREDLEVGPGDAGDITIISRSGSIRATGEDIVSISTYQGSGGDILLQARQGDIRARSIRSFVGTSTFQNGDVILTVGAGNGGNITIEADGHILVEGGVDSFTGIGRGGNLSLIAGDSITSEGGITTFAIGGNDPQDAQGGTVFLEARNGRIRAANIVSSAGSFNLSAPGLSSFFGSPGIAGNITLIAREAIILSRAISYVGVGGTAGDVILHAGGNIRVGSALTFAGDFDEAKPNQATPVDGIAGDISLTSRSGNILLETPGTGALLAFSSDSSLNFSEISLRASQGNITLDGVRLTTTNEGRGLAGNIIIDGDTVEVFGSTIESEGSSGRIFIRSTDPQNPISHVVIRNSNLTTETFRNSTIDSPRGIIEITAGEIEISQNSLLSASTNSPEVNAGSILLSSPLGGISITDSSTVSSVTNRGSGNLSNRVGTPNIEISGNSINILNNSEVTTSTLSPRINAGSITLNANSGNILIDDNSTVLSNTESNAGLEGLRNIPNVSIRGNLVDVTDNSSVRTDTFGRTRGGDVTVDANQLLLRNSVISASTRSGQAGNVEIFSSNSVEIVGTGSRIAAEATGGGIAGSLTITTDDLAIREGAEATVSSGGVAGNLTINADSIELDNGELTAIAGQGEQADITIALSETLFQLYNDSLISAGGINEGSGGNVNISAGNGFILADPYGDSDILANATQGRGGDIDITAFAIFGLEERDPLTDLSDINAASEFNASGSITLNTLNIDPTRGLGELPIEIVNAANLVAEGCIGSDRTGVDRQGEFTRTGRGGQAPSPSGALTDTSPIDQLATLDQAESGSAPSIPPEDQAQSLVEAQGLALDESGKVSLVPTAPTTSTSSSTSSGLSPTTCIIQ